MPITTDRIVWALVAIVALIAGLTLNTALTADASVAGPVAVTVGESPTDEAQRLYSSIGCRIAFQDLYVGLVVGDAVYDGDDAWFIPSADWPGMFQMYVAPDGETC